MSSNQPIKNDAGQVLIDYIDVKRGLGGFCEFSRYFIPNIDQINERELRGALTDFGQKMETKTAIQILSANTEFGVEQVIFLKSKGFGYMVLQTENSSSPRELVPFLKEILGAKCRYKKEEAELIYERLYGLTLNM